MAAGEDVGCRGGIGPAKSRAQAGPTAVRPAPPMGRRALLQCMLGATGGRARQSGGRDMTQRINRNTTIASANTAQPKWT